MAGYLIAHDLGTSANKAALLDLDGHILKTHTVDYPMAHPHAGWAEQDPSLWWQAFCRCNRAVLEGIDPAEVAGIAVTGQMMCCLALDAKGAPLYPGMLWADTRARDEAEAIERAVGADAFYNIVGMRAAANYALPKMMWLKRHQPAVYAATKLFLTPKDYINFRLTGRFATDPENAAYLHAYDLHTGRWSDTLTGAAGIDAGKLPEILPADSLLGGVTAAAAAETGLAAGTPVAVGMGDGGTTTLGTGTIEPGEGYISLGTSSWVCVVTGSGNMDPDRSISKLKYLSTLRDSGTMQAGGFSYSWLRDTLFSNEALSAEKAGGNVYAVIDELAAASPPGARGVLYLPYLLGERAPLWDTRIKGAFLGLSGATNRADLARGVLEGVAYHMNSIFQTILQVNGLRPADIKRLRLVGGGAKSPLWQQIFADLFEVPISTAEHSGQAGVLGTAILAGVALGLYPDCGKVRDFLSDRTRVEPDAERSAFYRRGFAVFTGAERALRETNYRLGALTENKD